MFEIQDPWGTSDSPLWDARGKLIEAIDAAAPPEHWELLDDAKQAQIRLEQRVLLQAKVAAAFLSGAQTPLPDTVIPVLDQAVLEIVKSKVDSEVLTKVVDDLKGVRATFVEHTMDPEKWAVKEDKKEDTEDAPADDVGEEDEAA